MNTSSFNASQYGNAGGRIIPNERFLTSFETKNIQLPVAYNKSNFHTRSFSMNTNAAVAEAKAYTPEKKQPSLTLDYKPMPSMMTTFQK